MLADAAILYKGPLEVAIWGIAQLAIVLSVAWFGTRRRRSEFSLAPNRSDAPNERPACAVEGY